MDPEKERFLDAIATDRYNGDLRRVFSDWLEENGYDDEAAEQRRMATPQWIEAAQWFEYLADQAGSTGYDEPPTKITYEMLIQAGHDYLNEGEYFTQMGSETLRDMPGWPPSNIAELFWKHWHTLTGQDPGPAVDIWPFSCSC